MISVFIFLIKSAQDILPQQVHPWLKNLLYGDLRHAPHLFFYLGHQFPMPIIIRVCQQRFFSPGKCIWKILLLAKIFRNGIQQMFQGGIPVFRGKIQYFFKISHSTLVIFFNRVAASPANKAFFVVRVQCQSARIILNRIINPLLDFADFTQIKIRVITIFMTVERVHFDDCLKCPNSTDSIGLMETS